MGAADELPRHFCPENKKRAFPFQEKLHWQGQKELHSNFVLQVFQVENPFIIIFILGLLYTTKKLR